MKNSKTTYIIFGASGDLAKRYVLPALEEMAGEVHIVAVSRKDYDNLKNLIPSDGTNKIFHLAIPPEGVPDAIKLISENFGRDNLKIMLEKPFGEDLKSAEHLVAYIGKYFSPDQIYRVDHYLAKESLQDVAKEKWDRGNIASIEILASEKIDIQGRVNFYEKTGALKDFIQSHVLEMAAVVLSGSFETTDRYAALKNLAVVCDVSNYECVKRGQYEGYRQEVKNEKSMTETFVSIHAASNDPLWRGVGVTLSTGKALKDKFTQVRIKYKDENIKIFNIEHEPDAYKKVIQAAMRGDQNLFVSNGEVLETWRILADIQETWKNKEDDLIVYKKGSEIEEVVNL